jgi:hypothetical protein
VVALLRQRSFGAVLRVAVVLALGLGHSIVVPAQAQDSEPLVARYRVTIIGTSPHDSGAVREQEWVFIRQADCIEIDKGETGEVWRRQPNGVVSLQRVLHSQQRVIDYSAGELAALGVQVDWSALELFSVAADGITAERDATAQLPVRWAQPLGSHAAVQFELIDWRRGAPPDVATLGERSASYLHIDAADFGDMPYDPAVRAAESMDVRAGWRLVHRH